MKNFTCILLALLLILQAGTAGAATRAAKPRVAAPSRQADLLLPDPARAASQTAGIDLAMAAVEEQKPVGETALAKLGLAVSRQVTIGLAFRRSATDEHLAQLTGDGDVVDAVIDHLLLGFHCKF